MNNVIKTCGVAAISLLAIGAQAAISLGETVSIKPTGFSSSGDYGTISYNNVGEYVWAGAISVTATGAEVTKFDTFCTDIWEPLRKGSYTALAFDGQTGVNPNWSNVPKSIQCAAYIYNKIFPTAVDTAAIQLAIWEVLYDTAANTTSWSLTSGAFKAKNFSATTLSDAATYLSALSSALTGNTFVVYDSTWLKPVDPRSNQGLLYTPVPEPTTIVSGALLLLPFGLSALRIVRKN